MNKKTVNKKPVKKVAVKAKPAKGSAKVATKPVKAAKTANPPPKAAKTSKLPSTSALQSLLTPLDDRLLIFVEPAATTTASGLHIPGNASTRPSRGQVVAKGSGRRNKKGQVRPLDVNVGDLVLFPEFSGTAVTLQGTELLILREDEVLGIAEV